MQNKRSFFDRLTGNQVQNPTSSMPVFTSEENRESFSFGTTSSPYQASSWDDTPAEPEINYTAPMETASTPIETNDGEGQLTVDMYQTENDIVIKSTIAGVKPEDLDVSINNDMVTIKGERKTEETVEHGDYYYQECYWGSFSRSILLPVDVLPEKADAALKNGILSIRLPKADTTKTKKIQVRGF